MNPKRILQLNAAITAASAVFMIATRSFLYQWFNLESPLWLDVATVVFIGYAAALVVATSRTAVPRPALWAFAIGDGACFLVSMAILLAFWTDLTPIARALIALTAVVVDGFAMAQYRAARAAA